MSNALIAVLVAVGIVLLIREVWCWYWKINAAIEELKAIRALLAKIESKQLSRAIPGGGI